MCCQRSKRDGSAAAAAAAVVVVVVEVMIGYPSFLQKKTTY